MKHIFIEIEGISDYDHKTPAKCLIEIYKTDRGEFFQRHYKLSGLIQFNPEELKEKGQVPVMEFGEAWVKKSSDTLPGLKKDPKLIDQFWEKFNKIF